MELHGLKGSRMDWLIQLSQWDLNAARLGHTEVAVPGLAREPGRQPASKAIVEVTSMLEKKGRERWIVM